MVCEICGGIAEAHRNSCSDVCKTELQRKRRAGRIPLVERPICPICHVARELIPGERVGEFRRRVTCGDPMCATKWRGLQSKLARQARTEMAETVPVSKLWELNVRQRQAVLRRTLLGALFCRLEVFSV